MPATLTSPIAQPSVPRVQITTVTLDFEHDAVFVVADQVDNSTPPAVVGPQLRGQMTFSAFITAFQAASGTAKQKGYTAALGALGLTASSIT